MPIDMREQRFGVEIEATGITRAQAAEILGAYFSASVQQVGGSYGKYVVEDSQGRSWCLMSDASVRTEQTVHGAIQSASKEYSCELVTPICAYADIPVIQEIIRRLRAGHAFVNSSCGLHVHVDGANHTARSLKNLLNIFYSKQDLIYQALEVGSARTYYCKKFTEDFISSINCKKESTIPQLREKWYRELSGDSDYFSSMSQHYNSSRYHGLNIHSYFYRGTVEWRVFNSTLHAGKIKAYIQFCLAMSAQAINQTKALARPTVSTNPRFTFRTWLLHLGLIGDEFSTARLHLLEKLSGSSAWRYDESHYPYRQAAQERNDEPC